MNQTTLSEQIDVAEERNFSYTWKWKKVDSAKILKIHIFTEHIYVVG